MLRSALGQAVRRQILVENPCIGIQLLRQKRAEMQALGVEECKRSLDAARQSDWSPLFAPAPVPPSPLAHVLPSIQDETAARERHLSPE